MGIGDTGLFSRSPMQHKKAIFGACPSCKAMRPRTTDEHAAMTTLAGIPEGPACPWGSERHTFSVMQDRRGPACFDMLHMVHKNASNRSSAAPAASLLPTARRRPPTATTAGRSTAQQLLMPSQQLLCMGGLGAGVRPWQGAGQHLGCCNLASWQWLQFLN